MSVWYHGQRAHYTYLFIQSVNFYNVEILFSAKHARRFETHLDRRVLSTDDLEASSHQVKGECAFPL